ncbi:MAG: hypothetical protein GEV28_16950 [Actinophytocola sp.]|nr:hypothetical protein [Actinophytocola sp.]MPZ81981.1 hypothetical protein [Actinophytocola sp.]
MWSATAYRDCGHTGRERAVQLVATAVATYSTRSAGTASISVISAYSIGSGLTRPMRQLNNATSTMGASRLDGHASAISALASLSKPSLIPLAHNVFMA